MFLDLAVSCKHAFSYNIDMQLYINYVKGDWIHEMQIVDSGKIERFENRKRSVSIRIVRTGQNIQSITWQL